MLTVGQVVVRVEDNQIGRVLDIMEGVVLFLPYNTGMAELALVRDLTPKGQ